MAIKKGDWVHFIAIGGTGMGALAALLKDSGFRVTGSDGPLYPPMSTFLLEEKKIPVVMQYKEENLTGKTWGFSDKCPALVVIGNAISRGHVEAQKVEEWVSAGECQKMSFAEGLAHFAISENRSFVVVGTHGKTTTTSLLTWCFEALRKSPGFFIGGIPKNFGSGCRMASSAKNTRGIFVSEGDEYDTAYWDKESKFLHYRPSWTLCTGIELDHVDIFKDIHAVEAAFVKLVSKIKEGLVLIDDKSAPRLSSIQPMQEAALKKGLSLVRYGTDEKSDYYLKSFAAAPLPWNPTLVGTKIHLVSKKFGEVHFYSPMIGLHNALNVVGVAAVLMESKELESLEKMENLLKNFQGIKRRQEEVFVARDFIVIDDFAHHPTAIKETLRALEARYAGSKMAAFFEPRSATSARNALQKDFEEAFGVADAVFLTPPTKTNIPEAEKLNVKHLSESIQKKMPGKKVYIQSDVDLLAKDFFEWKASLKDVRVVAAVMTNGPFGGLHKKLEKLYLELT